ncbi:MAG: hypothetical protein HC825_02195 [Oscillatoriales cyanobacterium RM1_1_9]|nr:hypothetical protein [Oscillatoriales cyanobacterium RM1_1_9]
MRSQSSRSDRCFDAVIQFTGEGTNRFSQSLDFVRDCQKRIIKVGDFALCHAPHFCCSFTFFDDNYPGLASPLIDLNWDGFPPAKIFLPGMQLIQYKHRYFLTLNLIFSPQQDIEATATRLWNQVQKLQFCSAKAVISPAILTANLSTAEPNSPLYSTILSTPCQFCPGTDCRKYFR